MAVRNYYFVVKALNFVVVCCVCLGVYVWFVCENQVSRDKSNGSSFISASSDEFFCIFVLCFDCCNKLS